MKAGAILCACLFLLTPYRLSAQQFRDSVDDARVRHGIRLLYNLSFDSARTDFMAVTRSEPDHPGGYFFLAMIDWWKIMTNFNDRSRDEHFYGMLDKVIEMCDQRLDRDENDVTALFYKGGALGFEGRLHGNREDWLKAANASRLALPIVRKAYSLAPTNADILFGISIYNYYAAVIPERYPFIKPFMVFFPDGDRQKGLRQLRTASEKGTYARLEATYFLLQVLHNYEKRYDEGLVIAQKLHGEFPANVVFHRYIARSYAGQGMFPEMKKVCDEILSRCRAKWTGYDESAEREAMYYLGTERMQVKDYETALKDFYRSDELSRALDAQELSGFMVMVNLKIGMIYDIQGKRDLAVGQYKKVIDMKDFQEAHAQAEVFLKTPCTKP
jgi:tetratricopeptide (TPR) repeat protein